MGSVDELAPLRDFRVRILPVLGPLPALFGLHIAMYVLCELAGRASEQASDPYLCAIVRSSTSGCGKTCCTASRPLRVKKSSTCAFLLSGCALPLITESPLYNLLPLTTADIALLYDDFGLRRSIVRPHAACMRPALVRWDPRVPQPRNVRRGEMKEVSRAMSGVFAMPDKDAVYEEIGGLNRAQSYVDALGEPINLAWLDHRIVIWSSEEVWGVEVVVSCSLVLCRHGGFVSGHCSNMFHFRISMIFQFPSTHYMSL
jgi:tRNA threonylcarbamoyladenosine dehydratase